MGDVALGDAAKPIGQPVVGEVAGLAAIRRTFFFRSGFVTFTFALIFPRLLSFSPSVLRVPLCVLTRSRLETAAGLLQDADLGLAEIASRVGYESEAAFSKAFRRRFGLPPGAYRKKTAA